MLFVYLFFTSLPFVECKHEIRGFDCYYFYFYILAELGLELRGHTC
jgi:cell wall-associated NlpC family hydrolase